MSAPDMLASISVKEWLALQQTNKELLDALRKLANETGGMLAAYADSIRDIVGNTNIAVLRLRVDEARAAIDRAEDK